MLANRQQCILKRLRRNYWHFKLRISLPTFWSANQLRSADLDFVFVSNFLFDPSQSEIEIRTVARALIPLLLDIDAFAPVHRIFLIS